MRANNFTELVSVPDDDLLKTERGYIGNWELSLELGCLIRI